MKLNYKRIEKREKELRYFNGFLPPQFLMKINMMKRNRYLKSIGAFDEVEDINYKVRNEIKSADDPDAYEDLILKKWIVDNPKFKDLVIFDE